MLFLTAHLGGWEIGSFAHSIYGHPLQVVVRALDNPYLDRFVDEYRTLHGNRTFEKQDFARGLLAAMKKGETVGLLMDQNMTPPQGVFVNFFGIPACTASGLARVALHTDAAVIPAFTIWDSVLRKYRVRFDPALTLVHTGDPERDVIENTALFTKVIEDYVRQYPEQWLWVHKRWKTRPEGQPPLYRPSSMKLKLIAQKLEPATRGRRRGRYRRCFQHRSQHRRVRSYSSKTRRPCHRHCGREPVRS